MSHDFLGTVPPASLPAVWFLKKTPKNRMGWKIWPLTLKVKEK